MYKLLSRDLLAKQKPQIAFPDGFRLDQHMREMAKAPQGHHVYEFIGTDSFGTEWNRRQQFEINAGRDEEPVLYTPLYEITANSALPKNIDVSTMGPGGVVFNEVFEGGEVQFSDVTSGQFTVGIRHWATGLEYSKDLVIYNELWNVGIQERAMGIAHNALLNHLHFGPLLTYTYPAANKTAATNVAAEYVDELMFTLEAAIRHARADTTNPRRGPYTLLVGSDMVFALERLMTRVAQTGFSRQTPSALEAIRNVIVYDGWTGVRGYEVTTYPGVTAGKSLLVSQQYKGQDFRSFEKQALQNEGTETDLSRFLTQSVWDSYYGVYANPLRSTEEITWPTS